MPRRRVSPLLFCNLLPDISLSGPVFRILRTIEQSLLTPHHSSFPMSLSYHLMPHSPLFYLENATMKHLVFSLNFALWICLLPPSLSLLSLRIMTSTSLLHFLIDPLSVFISLSALHTDLLLQVGICPSLVKWPQLDKLSHVPLPPPVRLCSKKTYSHVPLPPAPGLGEDSTSTDDTFICKRPHCSSRWDTHDTKMARLLSCTLPDTMLPPLLLRCQIPSSRMSSFMTVTSTNRTHKINGFITEPNPQTVTEAIWVIPYLSGLCSTSSAHSPPKRAEMSRVVQLWEAAGMEGSSSWAYNGNHLPLGLWQNRISHYIPSILLTYMTGDFQCHVKKKAI